MLNFFKDKQFNTFEELESSIANISDTTEKGDIFELFNGLYFEYFKDFYNLKNIWFDKWPGHEIPNSKKIELQISTNDKGADGLIETNEGKHYVVQTKFRSDRSSASYSELTNTVFQASKCDGMYIFANSNSIPKDFDKNENIFPILIDDLIDLDEHFFLTIHKLANDQKIPEIKKLKPYKYQQRAIDKIVSGFKINNRGKYIAACGSGKTLTSLWVKEELDSDKTLFVVPSIYLIKQTLKEWIMQRSEHFAFCCICSGGDINVIENDEFDSIEDFVDLDPRDLGVQVTTSADELVNFLEENKSKKIVIFSTYQSSQVVSDAARIKNINFDLTICDEAHKTAGVEKKVFSNILNDEFINSKKRLFLTATPKLLSAKAKITAEKEEFSYASMDDENIYGPPFDTFSFEEAIKEKAIVDYEILIMAFNEEDLLNFAQLNGASSVNGRVVQNKDIAITIGTEKLMSDPDYEVDKALNFSNTIRRSKEFIENIDIPGVDQSVFGVKSSISSKDTSLKRKLIMQEFVSSEKAILSNARCLTEGIDVPGVDAVIFSDRKQSPIDIVQSAGRALRINKNKPDKIARIFIPIFLDSDNQSLDIGKYLYMFEVIESLRLHDSDLAAVIDDLHGALAGISTGTKARKIKIVPFENIDIDELKNLLIPQIAKLNGDVFKGLQLKYSGQRTVTPKTEFRIVGRYNFSGNSFGNLFSPEKFQFLSTTEYKRHEITDNNFASHGKRLGLIETQSGGRARLTSKGYRYVNGEPLTQIAAEYFEQIDSIDWHPYEIVKEILATVKKINDFGWMYGLNIIKTDREREDFIQKAIKRIQFINSKEFNFNLIKSNYSTCLRVIDFLNAEFRDELDLFKFTYDPDLHIYQGGLKAELPYLGNHMTSCWPDEYLYDAEERVLSIK